MSETQLSKSILDAVNMLPDCYFFRVNAGQKGRTNSAWKGTPDIIGYVGALFVGLEVKSLARLKDKASDTYKAQLAWREKAGKAGAVVHVVTSARQAVAIVQTIQAGGVWREAIQDR